MELLIIQVFLSNLIYFFTEFLMATCNREHMLSKDKLEVAFKMFDKVY